jgi:ABC-2 type transport system permease protein
MAALTVARFTLLALRRDRSALLLALVLPVLLLAIFGFVLDVTRVSLLPPPELMGHPEPWPVYYAAALVALFLLFTMARGGELLLDEEASGFLERLRLAPVAEPALVAGKLLAMTALGVAELAVFFAVAELRFHLGVGSRPGALAAVSLAAAFTAAAIVLLVAALAPSRRAFTALGALVILGLSAGGGSIVPHVFLPRLVEQAGRLSYNRLVIDGYTALLGEPATRSTPYLAAALIAFEGAICLAAAFVLWVPRLRRGRRGPA